MGQTRTQTKEKAAPANPSTASGKPKAMTKEEMEMAAYFHWLGRGCPNDDSLTDWIEVERKWGGESISKKMDVQA